MATPAEGIWNQLPAMHSSIAGPMASTNSGSASNGGSASISANDFLTLLVTEMQNQDPTAQTDPNEYINQLVQVNSLEQLISINQTLTTDSAAGAVNSYATGSDSAVHAAPLQAAQSPTAPQARTPDHLANPAAATEVSGNLSIPPANPAAIRVAQALVKH